MRDDKLGHIHAALPPILKRLGILVDQWVSDSQQFEVVYRRRFNRAVPTSNTG